MIDSNISHDEFLLINNVLKKYEDMKKKKKKYSRLRQFIKDFSLFIKQFCQIAWSVEKNMESKKRKFVKKKRQRIMLLSNCAVCYNKK